MLKCDVVPDHHNAHLKFLSFIRSGGNHLGGLDMNCWAMSSCGVGELSSFNGLFNYHAPTNWQEKAEFLAHLYKIGYQPGNFVYSLSSYQLEHPAHLLFLTLGATEIVKFPNLTHGPSSISMFHVNIRRGVGLYFDKFGNVLEEQTLYQIQRQLLPQWVAAGCTYPRRITMNQSLNQSRVQQYLNQYKEHTSKLNNGDHVINITRTMRDVFSGEGWNHRRRERLVNGKWVYQRG